MNSPTISAYRHKLALSDVWPITTGDITRELALAMDELEYRELVNRVYKRIRRTGASRKHAKHVRRRLLKLRLSGSRLRSKDGISIEPSVAIRKFRPDRILDTLVVGRSKKWLAPVKREKRAKISLKNFSFIDNPEQTIEVLKDVVEAECVAREMDLDFDDPQVDDVSPYLVLGLMRQNMLPVQRGGNMPRPIQKVVEAVRLRHFLMMAPFSGPKDTSDVWAYPLVQRQPASGRAATYLEPTKKEVAAVRFVKTINEWLSKMEPAFGLTGDGEKSIGGMLDEILDNAQRHASPTLNEGKWSIAGYMARRLVSGRDSYACHVSIVNLGRSIAESMMSAPNQIRNDMEEYAVLHEGKHQLTKDELRTVYAMQDSISSREKDEASGGYGIMSMLNFLNEIGGSDTTPHRPRISILSGNSYIIFKGPYRSGVVASADTRIRQQWFNNSNDLQEPPDPDYVRRLGHRFPGTIISIRFWIDPEMLAEAHNHV